MDFKRRAEASKTHYHNEVLSLLDIATKILPAAALLANPHWEGYGSTAQYKIATPTLRELEDYDI